MAHSLRLITYLVPSHPVEMYECIAHFLEEELKVSVTLVYESRDPIDLYNDDRPDPFCLKEVDIGFLSPTQYLKMKTAKKIELLPITPVFVHPKNMEQKPGYFADVIVHTDVGKTVKSFLDLRGCNWGYTGDNSLSSSVTIQKLLRTNGENSSFFGNTIKTGNHLLTVEKVQDKQVIAAGRRLDGLLQLQNVLHKDADDITVLDSVGALPPYAIVCGKYLNGDLKSRIVGALLKATITRSWKVQFERFGLIKFVENSNDAYTELEFDGPLDGNGLSSIYY
ncbi:uncharacterized protein LOC100161110 [Acyrthosiphon pisum]|uniref:ACYPI002360 protein n=1 Tax=Acyrthosiphon pisum TaxID=7029 RepID=C4WRP7_ACYPI|nr:uncharacterized protein LOC100161110 [Acyrthosiphon pisum]BAH70567.1 ACYPI002360 [Acyrthosiphon pisum]|eukprot:NP_001155473.1 uncharacterized protein LOC100161110 [Acyrthosiphon pisum]